MSGGQRLRSNSQVSRREVICVGNSNAEGKRSLVPYASGLMTAIDEAKDQTDPGRNHTDQRRNIYLRMIGASESSMTNRTAGDMIGGEVQSRTSSAEG